MNLVEEGSKLDFKSSDWNLFSQNVESFMSKRFIHVAKINRMRGVKIWLLELATVENRNANRMRKEG